MEILPAVCTINAFSFPFVILGNNCNNASSVKDTIYKEALLVTSSNEVVKVDSTKSAKAFADSSVRLYTC